MCKGIPARVVQTTSLPCDQSANFCFFSFLALSLSSSVLLLLFRTHPAPSSLPRSLWLSLSPSFRFVAPSFIWPENPNAQTE